MCGCGHRNDDAAYSATEVKAALERHGFDVEIVFDRTAGDPPQGILRLINLFSDPVQVNALVADSTANGAVGTEIGAWLLTNDALARRFRGAGVRLQQGNLVIGVTPKRAEAARAALADLR
jgi:hypothetical protein